MNTHRDDDVPIPAATLVISTEAGKLVSDQVVRNAARRIGALRTNAQGIYVVSREIVEVMKYNYARMGFLLPRRQRAEHAQ